MSHADDIARAKAAVRSDPDEEVRIALPWPPSTNALYVSIAGHKRVRSKEYDNWRREAGWTLQAQRPPKFTGPVAITIELCSPFNRAFDPDNRCKASLDLLVEHQVIPDDKDTYVRSVTATVVKGGAPCTVTVRSI